VAAVVTGVAALLALSGCGGGSGKVAVPATASPVTAGSSVASSAAVGVVAIGHSGLTGENSDPARPAHSDAPENSWATGTSPQVNSVYTRLAAIRPETKGHVANTAQGGAKAESLAAQARAALLKVPTPALVIIQTIDNDIRCDGTDASHVGEFGTQVADALNVITTASPRSQILIVGQLGRPSPTFIEKLVVKVPAVKADLTTGDACAFYDSTGALVTSNFATLTTIIDSYEAEQTRQCSAVPNCATELLARLGSPQREGQRRSGRAHLAPGYRPFEADLTVRLTPPWSPKVIAPRTSSDTRSPVCPNVV